MTWIAHAWTGGGWRRALSAAPPLLVAVLPKCPVCLAAHASVAGAIGAGGARAAAWAPYAAALALAAALGLLGYGARSRRGYAPLALGCVAATMVLVELFHRHAPAGPHGHGAHAAAEPHAQLVTWTGVALLAAASLWNAWPRRARSTAAVDGGCAQSHC